ncbi:protein-export chaperone SecB [Capnocytophaga sputigena]|jgi:preprotein translocase subunit secB|uniref:protein-export chaperone SecB n=1 Tax=Capnocytophaga sputigena TaxID=1019 RepID=UPI0028D6E35C|nr:protein-export chaperone SecB [Capnocytophaga sputigena]
MEVQNKIHLERTFVKSITFEFKKEIQEGELNTSLEIKTNFLFNDEIDKEYIILFTGNFENELFTLNIIFGAVFGTSETIDEDFKESDFVKINSPAIAFPFLRSFISNLTLNAGLSPFILPAYNFAKIKEETD